MGMTFGKRRAEASPPPLPIPENADKPKHIIQVFGTGGSGKTLYAKHAVRARVRAGGRVVMVDPNATFGAYGTVVSVDRAVAALASAGSRPFALVVRPEWKENLSAVFQAVYDAGRVLLVVDEAAEFGGRLNLDANFLRVAQKGRNRLVDILTTCQTPTDLDPRVRAQYSAAVTFRLAAPLHAERFAEEFARRPEIAPALLALPRFVYVRADFGGRITKGTLPDPATYGAP